MADMTQILTAALVGHGDSLTKTIEQPFNPQANKVHTCYVWGTQGGAAVTAYISPNGANWFPVPGVTITLVAGVFMFSFEHKALYFKINVTGGDGTTTLNAVMD